MFKNFLKTLSGLIAYQSLFYAIAFGLFALLLFQYWQMLNRPPTPGYGESSINGVPVQLWTPDRLFVGNENQQEFQIVIDDQKIPANAQITVIVDSPDKNAGFSRDFFTFAEGSSHDEINKAAVYYKKMLSPADSFVMQATIKLGNEQALISRTILVGSYSKNILVFLSALLAGILAALNLINHFGSLLNRNNAKICE
jgi:hypothetical protein